MTRGPNLAEVKALLQDRILDLCKDLLPSGEQHHGGYWLAKNPHRNDKRPSLVVYTTARVPGAWKDFGAEQFRGDVILLIQFVERLADTKEALRWARRWLNIEQADDESFRRVAIAAAVKQQKRAERDAAKLKKDRGRAFALWLNARKDRQPEAETYFREARGLDLSLLPKWPGAVRFDPAMPYFELAVRDARGAILRPPPEFPGIVTMLTDRDGTNGAIHRIFLKPDCTDKAELGCDSKGRPWPQRLCWPSYAGFMGRIWNGDGDMPIREAVKQGVVTDLVITEGLEDALAVAISDPAKRVWMGVSLSNLAHAYVDLPCIGDVFVWADNDWGKPQALADLGRAVAALRMRAPKKRIEVVRAPGGPGGTAKDANDLIRGRS